MVGRWKLNFEFVPDGTVDVDGSVVELQIGFRGRRTRSGIASATKLGIFPVLGFFF